MAVPSVSLTSKAQRRESSLTLTSSHAWTFLTPSPTSLNPSRVSSRRSCTRSRTRSVSLLLPSRATWLDSREMFDVREKSCEDNDCVTFSNCGSSLYWGSSWRRIVVGCDSRADDCSKDMMDCREDVSLALEMIRLDPSDA